MQNKKRGPQRLCLVRSHPTSGEDRLVLIKLCALAEVCTFFEMSPAARPNTDFYNFTSFLSNLDNFRVYALRYKKYVSCEYDFNFDPKQKKATKRNCGLVLVVAMCDVQVLLIKKWRTQLPHRERKRTARVSACKTHSLIDVYRFWEEYYEKDWE